MQPLAGWTMEAWDQKAMAPHPGVKLDWVPPPRFIVDPAREIEAMAAEVRNGFSSRSMKIRQLGYDPEVVDDEIAADNANADTRGFVFDTDPRRTSSAGLAQAQPAEEATDN
jgi:capsid protein